MKSFEMGGYLPLELNKSGNFFRNIDYDHIFEVNTGRTAIRCAVLNLNVKKVMIPLFYCPDVIQMLQEMSIDVELYSIGKDFLPIDIQIEDENTAVLLVNYYGIMEKQIIAYSEKFKKVILDQAHAFFCPPVMKEGVMNIYSCRKFFGVCDGAYLIGRNIKKIDLDIDISYKRAVHLLKSIEMGTNAAYAANKQNEQELNGKFLSMSRLTRNIMQGIDYHFVSQKRQKNFNYIHQGLKDIQLLDIPLDHIVPYAYPLLLKCGIHEKLVREKIYVPILWKHLLTDTNKNSVEYQYARNIMILPIDQRYEFEDLDEMIRIVRTIENHENQ